ncbi:hypothetical protein NC796_24320 [Aliifodinibius sp. S!AR15-10]|uniref:hypothetical protein n=1 Tax=Aliifodinibius sp. S!AR15-10 TaxID=2950437 RepID=UPI00285D2750|nr:hypothetical protein [Aliifodinibius sp. S!AR15-10]MDR8394296.1 hypothetical protein [Aliifodinibius sp. S!AR15-10]
MNRVYLHPFICVIILLLFPDLSAAQDSTHTVNVFLDCRRACDEGYVRDEINFVNYVRNKEDADVHILITRQPTGSGGDEFTLNFIGGNDFDGRNKVLKYYSAESDTQDEVRSGLNQYLKRGLFSYVAEHPVAKNLQISYQEEGETQVDAQTDKWNYWVFDINADMDIEAEESQKEFSVRGSISAERITPEWKFIFDVDQFFERQTFEDDDESETFTREFRNAELLLVKSLGQHWSAGISSRALQSTRNNYDFLLEGSPAIEYSIFPYEQFTSREITLRYRVTAGHYNYEEQTVFGKLSERLFKQQFTTNIEFTQPWGEFEANFNASAYLHDVNKNRLDTELQLDFRIYRGLSFYISGEYAWINDQLSIPAGEITDQEQLLNLREQATSYSYEVRIGLEFSFGSIYNNVVNPRL